MQKNRDITGLVRTPPSMAWLIRERATLQGQIDRAKKQLDELPRWLVDLHAQMDALDAVFPLHTVQVDPKVIKGKRKHTPALFKHGVVTRGILECLRLANGRPVYTGVIASHIAGNEGFEINKSNKAYLMRRVGKRANTMAREGIISRHHDISPGSQAEGRWSLADDVSAEADLKAA
jgi:hypothetical protein